MTDTSFADIRARVTARIQSLQQAPVSAIYDGRVYLVTAFIFSETIRQALYAPIAAYEPLSVALSQALEGNYTLILSNANVLGPDGSADVCTEPPATSPPQVYTFAREATIGVACGDSQALAPARDTLDWAAQASKQIASQSETIGEAWANNPLICADWPFTPPYAFAGPFGSPAPPANSTSRAPLLILSTRLDHATPLSNAFALSRLHGGSAVVVQESVGHCAILSSVSPCVNGILKEYFRSGTVPANGTVCADQQCKPEIPFKACPGLLGA
jgi:autophagy-related protein 17